MTTLVDKCSVDTPFTTGRQHIKRHAKRRCYEVPSSNGFHEVIRPISSVRCKPEISSVTISQQQPPNTPGHQAPARIADCLKPYVTADSQWWQWKYNSRIHYKQQGLSGPCILLVHGFGVGAYHFDELILKLSATCQVWAVDLLGQGMSWPETEPPEGTLTRLCAHCVSYAVLMCFRKLRCACHSLHIQHWCGTFAVDCLHLLSVMLCVPSLMHTPHTCLHDAVSHGVLSSSVEAQHQKPLVPQSDICYLGSLCCQACSHPASVPGFR